MSGRSHTKPSERAVSTIPVPLSSIAALAAWIRSTARPNSNSGAPGSPEKSSIDNPATPVCTARPTFAATSPGCAAKPFWKSAFTGRFTAVATERRCASVWSRPIRLSGWPTVQAKPALVVASALNPIEASACALPTSQGFGITKHPEACNRRNSDIRSALAIMAHLVHRHGGPGPGPRHPNLGNPDLQRMFASQRRQRLDSTPGTVNAVVASAEGPLVATAITKDTGSRLPDMPLWGTTNRPTIGVRSRCRSGDRGLDIVHFEVGKRVFVGNRRALED